MDARAPAIARRSRHVKALGIKTVFEVFGRFTDDGKGESLQGLLIEFFESIAILRYEAIYHLLLITHH